MKKRTVVLFVVLAGLVAAVALFILLVINGLFSWINTPSVQEYPVRGVDVSSYQGRVDWDTIADQGIHFAFIKATEGSGTVDSRFAENWENIRSTSLRAGAYHFFSFDSAGKTQAENFVKTVPAREGMLPPVVDVELYGEHKNTPPDAETVHSELTALLEELERNYDMRPVLYATGKAYALFIENEFPQHAVWIRDVFRRPSLGDGRNWDFWQYSATARLEGYNGEEPCIDMNVFYGSLEEFTSYPN